MLLLAENWSSLSSSRLVVHLLTNLTIFVSCIKTVQSFGLLYDNYVRPAAAVEELLTRRGFLAETFNVSTANGYLLALTRGRNPLFANKTITKGPCKHSVLLIHGLNRSGAAWLSAANVSPKDFSNIVVSSMSEEMLHLRLGAESSARSIGFLLLNFGCEIWLLSRRSSLQSIGLKYRSRWKMPKVRNKKALSGFDTLQEGTWRDFIRPIVNFPAALIS